MNAFPVSVKGVVVRDERVLLLHNERVEWELPGGRLELGETPKECVAREIAEETGWQVGLFSADEVMQLNMPQGYRDSVVNWFGVL